MKHSKGFLLLLEAEPPFNTIPKLSISKDKCPLKLGRKNIDIKIDRMSLKHCLIIYSYQKPGFYISDNQSTNGTYVFFMKDIELVLKDGWEIKIGKLYVKILSIMQGIVVLEYNGTQDVFDFNKNNNEILIINEKEKDNDKHNISDQFWIFMKENHEIAIKTKCHPGFYIKLYIIYIHLSFTLFIL